MTSGHLNLTASARLVMCVMPVGVARSGREWMVQWRQRQHMNKTTKKPTARIANNTPARGSCQNCGETLQIRPCLNCREREALGF